MRLSFLGVGKPLHAIFQIQRPVRSSKKNPTRDPLTHPISFTKSSGSKSQHHPCQLDQFPRSENHNFRFMSHRLAFDGALVPFGRLPEGAQQQGEVPPQLLARRHGPRWPRCRAPTSRGPTEKNGPTCSETTEEKALLGTFITQRTEESRASGLVSPLPWFSGCKRGIGSGLLFPRGQSAPKTR